MNCLHNSWNILYVKESMILEKEDEFILGKVDEFKVILGEKINWSNVLMVFPDAKVLALSSNHKFLTPLPLVPLICISELGQH